MVGVPESAETDGYHPRRRQQDPTYKRALTYVVEGGVLAQNIRSCQPNVKFVARDLLENGNRPGATYLVYILRKGKGTMLRRGRRLIKKYNPSHGALGIRNSQTLCPQVSYSPGKAIE